MPTIAELKQREQRRMEFLGLLEKMERDDPSFVQEILGKSPTAGKSRQVDDGSFDAVKKVLDDAQNAWTETQDIIKASGLGKPKVSYVLSKTHADRFEKRKHPDHGKKLQWRLRAA